MIAVYVRAAKDKDGAFREGVIILSLSSILLSALMFILQVPELFESSPLTPKFLW